MIKRNIAGKEQVCFMKKQNQLVIKFLALDNIIEASVIH